MTQHIGVALSGGGHRATMWALGPLLYLVDAGKNGEVAAMSSVSGGSITNGVVAHETDFATTDRAGFDAAMRRLVRHVADEGLFFWGRATNAYLITFFTLTALSVAALVTGVVLLLVDAAPGAFVLAGALLLVVATAWWFERRSDVVDRALARTHFHRDGKPTNLADVDRSLDHVFCATELQSGGHVYLAPHFFHSYALGTGRPTGLMLSTAVQASACLPGAFAARRIPTGPLGLTGGTQAGATEMLLVDGGVYDNMADQWLDGLSRRLTRTPSLPVHGRRVDEVILVNASAPAPWRPMRRQRLVLAAEMATLRRVNDVMYQVTTQRRRFSLVERWDDAERSESGTRGALVHIAQSPYVVADRYRDSTQWPDRSKRARAVIELLGDDEPSRARWNRLAGASRTVPTVLRKLGRQPTVDLLQHSYVLAMANLHVLLAYPLLPLPPRQRFESLLVTLDSPEGSSRFRRAERAGR